MLETNRISELLESYIEYKHSLGFEIKQEISVLRNFQRYTLEKDYTGALTKNIVLEWISSGNQKYKTMGRKIEVLRPFMKYSSFFDSKTEVIYVSFSLYCKTRLFTFNFLNLQITQTLHGIS